MNLTASIRAAIAALPEGAEFCATDFVPLALSGGRDSSSPHGSLNCLLNKREIVLLRREIPEGGRRERSIYRVGDLLGAVEAAPKHRDDVGGVWGLLLRKPILRDKPTFTHKAD